MKVLDIQCANAHVFEGWFADEDAFQSQVAAGYLQCPVCGSAKVHKLLSAPRILRSAPAAQAAPAAAARSPSAQGEWLQRARDMVAQAEDVGERFAAEARAMQEGEQEGRAIRGVASADEARDLLAEGILVLPVPPALSGTLH